MTDKAVGSPSSSCILPPRCRLCVLSCKTSAACLAAQAGQQAQLQGWQRRGLAQMQQTDLSVNISVNASAVQRSANTLTDIVSRGSLQVRYPAELLPCPDTRVLCRLQLYMGFPPLGAVSQGDGIACTPDRRLAVAGAARMHPICGRLWGGAPGGCMQAVGCNMGICTGCAQHIPRPAWVCLRVCSLSPIAGTGALRLLMDCFPPHLRRST